MPELSDEEQIRALAEQWSRALEAKDIDAVLADYAHDVRVFDAVPPFESTGVEAFRRKWEGVLPYFPESFDSEHRDFQVVVGGDVAFAHGLHHFKTEDPTHPASQTWVRVTIGYRKIDGEWKAVHEHVSVPFDPMTGKAAFVRDLD